MTRLVAAELFKLRSTRTFYGLTLIPLGLILIAVVLIAALAPVEDGERPMVDLLQFSTFTQMFTLILGILVVTSEFRHGTITPSLLVVPERLKLMFSKLIASLLMGLALGLATCAIIAATVLLIGTMRGFDTGGEGNDLINTVVGSTLAAMLYAGFGVGLGALVRNQVGAIVGILIWLFVVELFIPLIPGVDEVFPKYGLQGARVSLAGQAEGDEELLSTIGGGLVLLGYVTVFCAVGFAFMRKKDVTA